MCKHDIHVIMPVYVWTNHPEEPKKLELKDRYIDACLAPTIYQLNQNGVITLNCCCGHRQDWRFNMDQIMDKTRYASILITNESIRHAESLGYFVKTVDDDATEIFVSN